MDFESVGVDRRLAPDLESGLFRMLDDALAAHTAGRPDTMSLHLDWGEHLDIELTAGRRPVAVADPDLPADGADLPPALADMVAERRRTHEEAVEAARVASLSRLPEQAWREVSSRARILGIKAEMLDDGARLHLEVDLPPEATDGGRRARRGRRRRLSRQARPARRPTAGDYASTSTRTGWRVVSEQHLAANRTNGSCVVREADRTFRVDPPT